MVTNVRGPRSTRCVALEGKRGTPCHGVEMGGSIVQRCCAMDGNGAEEGAVGRSAV